MTITIEQAGVDIPTLLYTGLFEYKDQIAIDAVGEDYVITYQDHGDEICDAIEQHIDLAGDYSELTNTIVANAGADMSKGIDVYLDSVAHQHRYNDMQSVRSYTGFDNVFRDECTVIAKWSADCWVAADKIEADVLAGVRALPTLDQVISELPELVM